MCGRYTVAARAAQLQAAFELAEFPGDPEDPQFSLPRYNVAPTQEVVIVRRHAEGSRVGRWVRWGLLPPGAPVRTAAKRINARSESVFETRAFKNAIRVRRCLVPSTGFIEWRRSGKKKQPYLFSAPEAAQGELFAMAGIWERAQQPDGSWIDSCSVLTCPPNELVADFHDRMPVILDEKVWSTWLDPQIREEDPLRPLLAPFPADQMRYRAVSPRVNSVRNDTAECLADHEVVPPPQLGFGFGED